MLPYLLAAALTSVPPGCPDLTIVSPRLKVVRSTDKLFDNYVLTVLVKNLSRAAQPEGARQHLVVERDGQAIGTQPVPALGSEQTYPASFRIKLPHQRKKEKLSVRFRYVLDDKGAAAREDCVPTNDTLDAVL